MNENSWNEKGLEHYRLGNLEMALECYGKALEINGDNTVALKNKTQILTELGRIFEALENVNKEIDLGETCENLNNKGNILNLLNRLPDSVKYYDRALELCPGNSEALYNKAVTLINLGAFERAIECLDLLGDSFSAVHLKADTYMQLGKFEEAIKCYDQLLEEKFDADAANNKAIALINQDRFEEALECYDRAIEEDSQKEEVWINRGQVLIRLNRFEDAISCFDRALEINPANRLIWIYRAQALIELGDEAEADRCFDNAYRN